jgi:glycosyltransferase involved in cell wall biosynthesis
LRVLVAGWLNSPHVAAWAEAVVAAGHEVALAGRVVPSWPELDLPVPSYRLPAGMPPPLRGLRMSNELACVTAEYEPDLVHAHYLAEYGWMAARMGFAPLICSAWGSDVLGAGRVARLRSRRAVEAAAVVLADSEHLARNVRALARRDVPVELFRWGLDLDRFSPGDAMVARESLGLESNGPLVAGVRGLTPLYNPEVLLEAFALVRRRHPDARLLLKHPLESTPPFVGEAIERLGLGPAVKVVGNVPWELLSDIYRAADVVVSIPSSDSSPRSVWEALACARPVVVSDLQWARDELAPGGRALLAPVKAPAIAEAIGRILDDEDLARQLGTAGRALAVKELDRDASAARIDELYRSVVGKTA